MEGNNHIPPSSPPPARPPGDKKTSNDRKSVAFTRKAQVVSDTQSKMKGLNSPENMPSKTLIERTSKHLSTKQRFQMNMLRLGCWLITGQKGRNWLAEAALNLMEEATSKNDHSAAVELQQIINDKLSPLAQPQLDRFNRQCRHFQPTPPMQPHPDDQDKKPAGVSFMTWIQGLYNDDNGAKAFRIMSKQFFDSVQHQLIRQPLRKIADKEEMDEDTIAWTFSEVALDAIDATNDPDELRKIQTMVSSMFENYPTATKCKYVLERVKTKLGQ